MDYGKMVLGICALILLIGSGCVNDNQPAVPAGTVSPSAITTATRTPVTTVILTTMTPPPAVSASDTGAPETAGAGSGSFNPLTLKSSFLFGKGTLWISEVAVNRIWINDTYRWYNPANLQYDTRVAPAGKKYLIIFISMINRGSKPIALPSAGSFYVQYGNEIFSPYAGHPLPMANPDSTPRIARIAEIEYSSKVYSSEFVEDFGYSHGQRLGALMPGESNAVEGYIIYEVPASLTPDKTYVRIVLPDKEEATWILV